MIEFESGKHLEEIQKQFLVATPLDLFEWQDVLTCLHDAQVQLQLLITTVNHPRVERFPVRLSYQKLFLKFIISKLEESNCEVADELYAAYCKLLSESTEPNASLPTSQYRHYVLPSNAAIPSVVVKESTNLLSSGTTGLSCWQAGVSLAEWCLANKSQLEGRCVLELGSGCGLTGIVVAAACNASHVVLTDGHEAVMEQLSHNVQVNATKTSPYATDKVQTKASIGQTDITILHLPWSQVLLAQDIPSPDLILAADVVFDPALFDELKNALMHLLSLKNENFAILACTLRNLDTLNTFKQLLKSNNLSVTQETEDSPKLFYYDRSTPIHIYRIKYIAS